MFSLKRRCPVVPSAHGAHGGGVRCPDSRPRLEVVEIEWDSILLVLQFGKVVLRIFR